MSLFFYKKLIDYKIINLYKFYLIKYARNFLLSIRKILRKISKLKYLEKINLKNSI